MQHLTGHVSVIRMMNRSVAGVSVDDTRGARIMWQGKYMNFWGSRLRTWCSRFSTVAVLKTN